MSKEAAAAAATAAGSCKRWVAGTFGGPAALVLQAFDPTEPRHGEVLLRISASTATYTDLLVLRGSYMPRFPVPVTPGYGGSGVQGLGRSLGRV